MCYNKNDENPQKFYESEAQKMKSIRKTRCFSLEKSLTILAAVMLLFSLLLSVCACGNTPEESTAAPNESENTPTEPPTETETEPPETLSETDRLYYDDFKFIQRCFVRLHSRQCGVDAYGIDPGDKRVYS